MIAKNTSDVSLNQLVDDAARNAVQMQKTTFDMAKSVRTASLEAVQSSAFREAMAHWISRYLAEKLISLKILVESRVCECRDARGGARDAHNAQDVRDAVSPFSSFLFPRDLFSRIREISIAILGTLAKRPEPLLSVDFDKVLNPHLDAVQQNCGIIAEFTALVLYRAGEIIADEN